MQRNCLSVLTLLVFLIYVQPASANIEQMKVYREVNPDLKPNCMYCHVDKAPKKEKGKNELNPYGQEAQKLIAPEQTENMSKEQLKELYLKVFKQLGRHDQFKAVEATDGAENETKSEIVE